MGETVGRGVMVKALHKQEFRLSICNQLLWLYSLTLEVQDLGQGGRYCICLRQVDRSSVSSRGSFYQLHYLQAGIQSVILRC